MVRWIRTILSVVVCAVLAAQSGAALAAQNGGTDPRAVSDNWYRLILELVRHTPTYSPPVASRSFAYIGVAAYESVASGRDGMVSLGGQLNGFAPPPARAAGEIYDDAVILQAAMSTSVAAFFANTGPSGQNSIARMTRLLDERVRAGLPEDVAARSAAYGEAVARHVLAWSETDGGAKIENMGFPQQWTVSDSPGAWRPTSAIRQQQAPLLPDWGRNRTFALPSVANCDLPPPPAYSEDPASAFYAEAREVYDTAKSLTDEQKAIARFWSDDPMLSATPPGHWIAITRQVLKGRDAPIEEQVDTLARVGIAMADAFIGCWSVKFRENLIRPVSYIRKTIDKEFTPLLITPPFPEYPSGHSVQSSAAAEVLTALYGDNYAFTDDSAAEDGLPARSFRSFRAAAEEAAISRLYGGIHFRSAIEQGLKQGVCIGAYAAALRTRK